MSFIEFANPQTRGLNVAVLSTIPPDAGIDTDPGSLVFCNT